MDVKPLAIPDVLLIDLDVHKDDRGHFYERFNEERFKAAGLPTQFRQDNHSRSRQGVLRGLHYQLKRPQGKLISCTHGSAFDVAVDIRVGSPTFGKWVGVDLVDERPQLLWIPPGFAHGFYAVSNVAVLEYKCSDIYVASAERGIRWDDPDIGIAWPLEQPILSARDLALPFLSTATAQLPRYNDKPK